MLRLLTRKSAVVKPLHIEFRVYIGLSVDNRWKLIGNMEELSTNKDEEHWLIIERKLLDDLTTPIKLTKSVQVC